MLSLAKTLQSIKDDPRQLDEEVIGFQMSFTVEVDGEELLLVPGRENILVPEENVEAYVKAVVDFYLDQNTEEEFLAFEEGFKAAANCDWLSLVEPSDLRLTFCGLQVIDWPLIKTMTEYHGDYYLKHIIIRSFWEFTATLDHDDSRRLLKLWTSSEVCPLTPPRLHIVSYSDTETDVISNKIMLIG